MTANSGGSSRSRRTWILSGSTLKYRDGVLQITVRRRESAQPRQIAVS